MSEFKFNKKNHAYTLDGKRLTGVTTIIGIIDKSGPLMYWAVGQAIDYVRENMTQPIDSYSEIEGGGMVTPETLDGAKTAWRTTRDKAGNIGTAVHDYVETYTKTGVIPEIKDEDQKKMFDKFVEWADEEGIKFLASEQKVYSAEHFYAGTFDFVFEKDGKKYIGDLKTAKDIYNTNYVQMAGYHICLKEMGKIEDLHGYCVVNIPKEFKKNGDAKLKVKYVYNTGELREAFLAALTLYRFVNNNK